MSMDSFHPEKSFPLGLNLKVGLRAKGTRRIERPLPPGESNSICRAGRRAKVRTIVPPQLVCAATAKRSASKFPGVTSK